MFVKYKIVYTKPRRLSYLEKKTINIRGGTSLQLSRERAGYTQEQFAELLDVGVQHISRVERGAVGISLTALKKTCEILGVSADYLLLGGSASEDGNVLLQQLRELPVEQGVLVERGISQMLSALELANDNKRD